MNSSRPEICTHIHTLCNGTYIHVHAHAHTYMYVHKTILCTVHVSTRALSMCLICGSINLSLSCVPRPPVTSSSSSAEPEPGAVAGGGAASGAVVAAVGEAGAGVLVLAQETAPELDLM